MDNKKNAHNIKESAPSEGINTYPADPNTLGIQPEAIVREAVNRRNYKSEKEAPVNKRKAMVDAQTITEMTDDKLQL